MIGFFRFDFLDEKTDVNIFFNLIEINFPARTYDVISDQNKNINQLTIINGKYFVVMFFLYTFASEITNKVLTYKIKNDYASPYKVVKVITNTITKEFNF